MQNLTANAATDKPLSELPTLRKHPNGQWYYPKRINGHRRNFYFGKDLEVAQRKLAAEAPHLAIQSQPIASTPSTVSVMELTDRFIVAMADRFKSEDIGIREFDDLRRSAKWFRAWAGEESRMMAIKPLSEMRIDLRKQYALNTFNKRLTHIRRMLKWGYKLKPKTLIAVPLHEDDALRKAGKKIVKREQREREAKHGVALYTSAECRARLLAAHVTGDVDLRAFLLLAMNAGMGQSHIADLPRDKVDLDSGYIDWVRTKNEELFQVTLWPITVEAIKATKLRKPREKEFAELMFLTCKGNAWVREYFSIDAGKISAVAPNDEIGKVFRFLEKSMALQQALSGADQTVRRAGRSFYAFRRTFATIANDTKDKDAVRRIQGQGLTGMDPHYVLKIPRERLQAVTDYVHRKLFNGEPHELSLSNLVQKLQV